MPLADVVVNSLTEIVGEAGVMTRPEEVIPYGFDGTAVLTQRPDAVVFPRTVEQVAECVAFASTSAVAIVVRGSGTGLSGGSVPVSGGLVLCLTRMDAVVAVDATRD
jgi:glycolate dehydrogenase FAD-linked subunit